MILWQSGIIKDNELPWCTEQDCNALLVVPSVVETLGEPIIPAGSVLEAIMLEKKRILRHVV
jgi:hypothetical protein